MKYHKQILGKIFILAVLYVVPSCTSVHYLTSPQGDGSGGSAPPFSDRHAEKNYMEWCYGLPGYIIPRMCAYYQLHPERFKPTGQEEEIEIAEFAAFIKNDSYFQSKTSCYVSNGTIFDPWGQPLHFVQDLNMDGYIDAEGERRVVMNLGNTGLNQEHHFGICKQSPFKGGYGQPFERIFAATY